MAPATVAPPESKNSSRLTNQTSKFIDSERYRQMLVRDGERRFREWHSAFLNYQTQFVKQLSKPSRR